MVCHSAKKSTLGGCYTLTTCARFHRQRRTEGEGGGGGGGKGGGGALLAHVPKRRRRSLFCGENIASRETKRGKKRMRNPKFCTICTEVKSDGKKKSFKQ